MTANLTAPFRPPGSYFVKMGDEEGATRSAKKSPHWLLGDRPWVMRAALAVLVGSAVAHGGTFFASELVPAGGTGFVASLAVWLFLGLFIGGFGQFTRAVAHGSSSKVAKGLDGWGKVLGVLGWSFAFVGTALSPEAASVFPTWILVLFVYAPGCVAAAMATWVLVSAGAEEG